MKRFLQFFFLFFSVLAYGQQLSYHREHVTDENGLLQNTSYGIAINKLGYAWVLSEYGLSRFDGATVKNYLNSNYFGSSNKKFYYLFWDQQGKGYASDFTTGKMVQLEIHPEEVNSTDFVTSRFHQIVSLKELKSKGCAAAYEQLRKNPDFYFTRSGEVYLFNSNSATFFSSAGLLTIPLSPDFKAIPVEDHIVIIQKNKPLSLLYKGKEIEPSRHFGPDSVRNAHIIVNASGTFAIKNNRLYVISVKDSIPFLNVLIDQLNIQDISDVSWDSHQKIVWVSSSTDGIYVFKKQQFQAITSPLNQPYINNFYSQTELKDGSILSAYSIADSNGVIRSQEKTKDFYNGAFLTDSANQVYFSNNSALFRADAQLNNVQKIIPLAGPAKSLLLQKDTMWIADRTHIRYCWQNQFYKFFPITDTGVELPEITTLFRQSNNSWIGTENGLYLLTPGSTKPVSIPELNNKRISYITACTPQSVFLGTKGQGCFFSKNGTCIALPMDKSHALNTVNAAIADQNGFLWITTNRGLLKARIHELEKYLDRKTEQVFYYYYYKEDGFATNEFNNASTSPVLIKKNGLFSLSSLKGLVWFNPYQLQPGNFPNTIVVDEVRVDDSLLVPGSNMELPSSYSNFSISISVPYWGNRNNLELHYKLLDWDTKWHTLENKAGIDFTKLPKGSYTLLIKVRTGFRDTDAFTRELHFTVLPAWYETATFRFVLILFLLLITYGIFRLRLAGIQREKRILDNIVKEKTSELESTIQKLSETVDELTESQDELHKVVEQKEKIASILAHDLRTPLKFMTMLSEYLNKNFDALPKEKIQHLTSELMNSSKGTFSFAEELMTWLSMQRNPKVVFYEENIRQIIDEICVYFSDIAKSQKTQLMTTIEQDVFAKTDERLLRIILRNLVDNAIKHTVNGSITLTATKTPASELKIEIKDTGKGMTAEQLQELNIDNTYGFSFEIKERLGFQIIKDFTLKLNGKVEIQSELNKGTTVTLKFPL